MIQPLGKNIVVEKPLPSEHKIKGIIVPASLEATPRFGGYVEASVVAVGPKAVEFKTGDKILMRAVWGDDYFHDNRTLTILTERAYRDCCHSD